MTKQVINLVKKGSVYKVASMTNRIDPPVGTALVEGDVKKLLAQANRIGSTLTVNIK